MGIINQFFSVYCAFLIHPLNQLMVSFKSILKLFFFVLKKNGKVNYSELVTLLDAKFSCFLNKVTLE